MNSEYTGAQKKINIFYLILSDAADNTVCEMLSLSVFSFVASVDISYFFSNQFYVLFSFQY